MSWWRYDPTKAVYGTLIVHRRYKFSDCSHTTFKETRRAIARRQQRKLVGSLKRSINGDAYAEVNQSQTRIVLGL